MAQKRVLSLNAMDKLIREMSGLRISDKAKEALAEVLEEQAKVISKKAAVFAEHAGRRTITEKDIQLALK